LGSGLFLKWFGGCALKEEKVENEVDFLFISNLVLLIYSITIIFVIYYVRNIVLKKLRWEE
jgi:hypothetical protein